MTRFVIVAIYPLSMNTKPQSLAAFFAEVEAYFGRGSIVRVDETVTPAVDLIHVPSGRRQPRERILTCEGKAGATSNFQSETEKTANKAA